MGMGDVVTFKLFGWQLRFKRSDGFHSVIAGTTLFGFDNLQLAISWAMLSF